MSQPNSPAAMAASNSSSAASTPLKSAQEPTIMLTPRSRVKQYMAQFDESDSDLDADLPKESEHLQNSKTNASKKPTSPSPREPSASDGDDEQPVSRPRGRMAARMLQSDGEINQDVNDASNGSQSDGQGAYARIRKQLMANKGSSQNDGKEEKKSLETSDADVDEEDEDSPVKPAKRIIRRNVTAPRNESPQSSASQRHASKSPSPGLFVSPAKSNDSPSRKNAADNSSGSEPDLSPSKPAKKTKAFQELVARKRAELREKQAKQKKKRPQKQIQLSGSEDDDVDTSKLTQEPRPLRKASKKAIEEMNRETQRISRNMQLAHQARTKKTFKTSDLFARFNFKPNSADGERAAGDSARSTHGSSDIEAGKEKDTPPTSPPSVGTTPEANKTAPTSNTVEAIADEEEDELLDISINPNQAKSDKGKGKAPATEPTIPKEISLDSSDDELEILPQEKSRFPVFDRLPAKRAREDPSLVRLRAFARLNSPSKSRPKNATGMTNNELQALMRRQASRQAKAERQERIDELKAKGVFIETTEEREREQLETENLLEKARQEADELRKAEKAKARREGKESADEGALSASDDGEDGDWNEEADMELSGSEEENEGGDNLNDEDEEEEEANTNPLLDEAAEQGDEEEEEEEAGAESEAIADDAEEFTQYATRIPMPGHRNRSNRVVVDEEDEEEASMQYQARPSTPPALVDDDIPDLGLGPPSSAPLGLTQMFAGSMAEDDDDHTGTILQKKAPASLDFLRQAPSTIPDYDKIDIVEQSPASMIQDTQLSPAKSTQLATPFQPFFATQMSQIPDPTQDEGFLKPAVPALLHSTSDTIDTMALGVPESPIVAKKGRLHRRKRDISVLSDAEDENNSADDEAYSDIEAPVSNKDAFNKMLKSSKKKAAKEAFDKKNSKAREIIEEQAEESEDEYAGLGGASDDESGGEMDQEIAAMIDDQGNFNGDERKLAAFYADKERADNERAVDKLYHDIATGGLRRKRNGADLDLSDSDDEAEERRRRKQREFARMRKALLADEKVGQIADNVKKAAFMRAIEDHEDESDFEIEEPAVSVPDSQDTSESQKLAEPESKGLKRNIPMDGNDENVEPAKKHPRRSAPNPTRKATTLAQVRETLSFLNEDSFVADSQPGPSSDAEDDHAGDIEVQSYENRFPRPSESIIPRTASSRSSSFVDRLQQRRSAASAAAVDGAGNSAMAFQNANATFRPPSLLKRATGLSTTSSSSSVSMSGGMGDTGRTVRMGGSKKSSIHYQAREAERKSKVHKVERRRDEKLKKAVKVSGKGGLLGALGRGGFE